MVSFTYDVFGKRTVTYQANGSTTPGQIELLDQSGDGSMIEP